MIISTDNIKYKEFNTIVVGSGAAAYNAANRLYEFGVKDLALVTENRLAGTSRNTGSDKQTYYKLSLCGSSMDSVESMAEELYKGGCIDGDISMAEAAGSVRSFMNLVESGVPFPTTSNGEYIGYKTDHDPAERGTSIGPLTSHMMTNALEQKSMSYHIELLDKHMVVKIIAPNNTLEGILCLSTFKDGAELVFIKCQNMVYATGGPAGIYSNNVYPNGHYGMSGIAFEAGVKGRNLTEWQFGLASIAPKWNVSGTYMQVLPRFISTASDGSDEREFLLDYFDSVPDMLSKIFLKGYQWPFDTHKAKDGSSIIDLLVFRETQLKKRRVFLSFLDNPRKEEVPFDTLDKETRSYLQSSGACFGKPIDRLIHMNKPAYDFYLNKGVDLSKENLEIDLCAQHNNGGLAVNSWWQTNISGFYACGEVAGTHGVSRPGGSALNAGQVGSLRAAQHIAFAIEKVDKPLSVEAEQEIGLFKSQIKCILGDKDEFAVQLESFRKQFSESAGAIRRVNQIEKLYQEVESYLDKFFDKVKVSNLTSLKKALRFRDILISMKVYASAIIDYSKNEGKSRGSSIYISQYGDTNQSDIFDDLIYFLDRQDKHREIQEIKMDKKDVFIEWRERKPLSFTKENFETVWRSYRENKNVGMK